MRRLPIHRSFYYRAEASQRSLGRAAVPDQYFRRLVPHHLAPRMSSCLSFRSSSTTAESNNNPTTSPTAFPIDADNAEREEVRKERQRNESEKAIILVEGNDEAADFATLLHAGIKEEVQRRKKDRFHLPLNRRGIYGAIELGTKELSNSKSESDDEKLERQAVAVNHLSLCLRQLPQEYFDCTEVCYDHPLLAQRGWTLLHYAAHLGNLDACRLLLRHQSSSPRARTSSLLVESSSSSTSTFLPPLGLAVLKGHSSVMTYLWRSMKEWGTVVVGDLWARRMIRSLVFAGCSPERLFQFWNLEHRSHMTKRNLVAGCSSIHHGAKFFLTVRAENWNVNPEEFLHTIFANNRRYPFRSIRFIKALDLQTKLSSYQYRSYLQATLLDVCSRVGELGPGRAIKIIDEIVEEGGLKLNGNFSTLGPIEGLVNSACKKRTTLSDTKHVIQFLLDKGADVNQLGGTGVRPLFVAAATSNFSLVEFLLSKGANPNLRSQPLGTLPIDWTCGRRQTKISSRIRSALIRFGAKKSLMKEVPQADTQREVGQTRRAISEAGLFRRVVPSTSQGYVISSLVGQATRNLYFEFGHLLSPKRFTPGDDHRLYCSACDSALTLSGATVSTRRCSKVSKIKLLNSWDKVVSIQNRGALAQLAEEGEGVYTIVVVAAESRRRGCGDGNFHRAMLKWKSSWSAGEEEEVWIPLEIPSNFDGRQENYNVISGDGLTLFFTKSLTEVMAAAMQRHNARVKKKVLQEAAEDCRLMKRLGL